MRDFARLLRRHEDGIQAHFDIRTDNGATEAINNNAKEISHRAHGFHSPEAFSLNFYRWLGRFPPPQIVHKLS